MFSAVTRKLRGTLEELHLWGAYYDLTIMLGVLLPHLILTVECFIIPISQMRTLRCRETEKLVEGHTVVGSVAGLLTQLSLT